MTGEIADIIEQVSLENDRRLAFIAGYGAALEDRYDDDVDTAFMSREEFSDHIRAAFREYEEGGG